MKISLRSIEAFKNISDLYVKKILASGELLKFPLGSPISDLNIPNKVAVIISGEARFFYGDDLLNPKTYTAGKDTFIGLASILRVKPCELYTAKNEVIALLISDELIIDLYKNDQYFRDWCENKLHQSELYEIIDILQKLSPKDHLNFNEYIKLLSENILIKNIFDNEYLENPEDYISIVGSENIKEKSIGDVIYEKSKINIRGIFPGRFFQLKKSIFNSLLSKDQLNSNISKNLELNSQLNSSEVKYATNIPSKTAQDIGQYKPEKKFKIIKAKGEMREALACLQMLADQLGTPYRVDSIEKIVRDVIKRGKKPNMQLLGGITSVMGLHAYGAKINIDNADRLPFPSIISWKDSFAIVKESNNKLLEIISPREGIIRLNPNDIKDHFKDDFIELLRVEKSDKTPEIKFGIQWLLPAINRYRSVLIQVLLASFVVQLFGLANPLMIQVIIDKVISQRSLDTLEILGIALVVVTILGGIISSLRTFLFNETTNRIDTKLGAEVIDHLLRLPLDYYDRRPVGELGSRIAELEKIRNFLTGQALTTILDAAFSLIYIVVMVIYSWLLTLLALAVVPIQIAITIIGAPLIRRQIREIAQENAKTQSHLVEVLTGIQTVKAQNIERVSRWKWQDLYGQYISKSFQKTLTGTALGETSKVLQQLSQLLVLWVGAVLVLKGQLSLGQLIAFRIISGYVTQPLLRLSTIWQNIQELKVSFERLADIVDTPEEATDIDKSKIPLPSISGAITYEDVSFKFDITQPEVLKKINLQINPGQFVGIVGQSGSGKSTLMKLLPRLYKPNSGNILIDGYNIQKVELYSLRRQVGIVPQEPLLFAGTVNSNIALTDPEAASDEIVKVAKIASAHEFIMQLEDGYSTKIGERGAGLSGGQKQRIAIARTLLSNPKLLILDEATSALDYQTEREVCEGLRAACKDSTVFFITHRLNTVKNADLIIMLHNGSIEEVGTHSELMSLKGRYFALFQQQESS